MKKSLCKNCYYCYATKEKTGFCKRFPPYQKDTVEDTYNHKIIYLNSFCKEWKEK